VVAYLEQAYRAAAMFADQAGEKELSEWYHKKSADLTKKINMEWWSADFGSFADFRASKKMALELTEAAIVRADTIEKPWSVDELQQTIETIKASTNESTQPFVVHHNWVVNTPMETGAASAEKASIALETAKKYRNRFGMFVTGIDRDEAQEEATQWKSFSYVGAVMTLPTGVQAIGSANYGQIDQTYDYLKRLQNSFGYALPGSMYEVSPDFGMMAQAWNAYAVAVPIVEHIGGIKPAAYLSQWRFEPQMPKAITNFELSDVRIGQNRITVKIQKINNRIKAIISQTDPNWKVVVSDKDGLTYNAKTIEKDGGKLLLSGAQIELEW
jgi:hypothetical protein